jgi:hypothetical protein
LCAVTKASFCAGLVVVLASFLTAQCPPGDLNHNCTVDLPDLVIFAEQWLAPPGCAGHANECADFYFDDGVNLYDFEFLTHAWGRHVPPVVINEFLAANNSRPPLEPGELLDEDGDSSDWIELYNLSEAPVELGGWILTIDPDHKKVWTIPAGVSLRGGEYLVLFASEKNRTDQKTPLHTDFALNKEGSYLALIEPDGVTIASAFTGFEFAFERFGYPPQETNVSYGRLETDLRYFSRPTPGQANNGEFLGFVGPVTASGKHGFFAQAFEVRLSCQTPDAKIRYTTDGSNPTEANGADYDPAKLIAIAKTTVLRAAAFKTGYQPSRTETNTYLFLDDVIEQSPDGAKPTEAWPDPYHSGGGQWIDYGMDPEVVTDPRYSGKMIEAMKAIPSISITTDLANLFDPANGIYVNAWDDGRQWERPCSMEMINPDKTEGFQVNAGLRVRGGFSRSDQNPKHAFRLFFRSQYGDSNLNYPLFGDEGVASFDKLDLRTDQNYSWSFRGRGGMDNGSKNTMVREVFSRDTQGEMGQPYTRSRHYHLYLNGQYWGIYQTEERSESRFAQDYLGGDSSQYDVTKVNADQNYTVGATDGTTDAYRILWKAAIDGFDTNAAYYGIQGLNPDGTPNPSKKKWLDVDNLIDYMAIIYYTGNYDAPLSNFLGNQRPNNYFAIVNRENPDGWKFICHDAEHSLFLGWDRTGPWENPDLRIFKYFNPQWLHQQLCAHPEYRMRFADRIHKYFFNDGLLTPDKAIQRFKARADRIQMAILGESARWGDSKVNKPRTKDDDWLPEITRLYEDYFPYRTDEVLQQFIWQGWYPTTIAPIFFIGQQYQHGGMVTPPDNVLNIINPNITGTLYYTLDGTDPRRLAAPPSPLSAQPASDTSSAQGSTDLSVVSLPPPADDELGNADIAWITDTDLDTKFTDLLEDHGYSVDRYEMLMRGPLDPYRAGMLNKAKLIIISSATLDISYDDPEGWNSITTPLILMNASLARSNRWDWVDSAAAMSHEPTDLWTPVPEDLLFFGLSMTGGNSVNVVTGNTTFIHVNEDQFGWPNYGNPKAFRIDEATPYLWIAQWDSWWNDPFYWGTDQKPAGGRMLLSMGGGLDTLKPFNLNASGKKLFLNAVEIMLHYENPQDINFSPYVWAGWDENIMWPDKEVELFGYVFDDGMLPDPNQLTWVWSKVEGPGEVTIVDSFTQETYSWGPYTYRYVLTWPTVSFSEAGIYELKLEAFDGEFYSSDTTVVKVLEPAASLTLTKSTRVKARILGEDGVWSALNEATYGMGPVAESLRISEIHYHPDGDPNSEFIEVVNAGNQSINISWAAFTEGIHFEFPDIDLAPGQYSVVVRNRAAFENRYGTTIPVAGEYSGNLDNSGEKIVLRDAIGTMIHSFKFSDGWYPTTDGQGFSLTFRNPKTTAPAAWPLSSSWRPSSLVGGSPGSDDDGVVPPPGVIVFNELRAHSDDATGDWIELYNTTPDTVNIGGWFLSDSNADDPNRMKFEIPEGTTIGGHNYKVFNQSADFGNPVNSACHASFGLSENGETVYLRSRLDNAGHFTGYFAEQKFDASLGGISIGRHVNSDGSVDFVSQSGNTPNEANAYPKVGPVVISEIYYNPPTGGTYDNEEYEFIELMNITSAPVTFQSLDNELNIDLPWAIDEGIQFVFPLNTTLGASKRMVLVRNPAAFTERFGSALPAGTVVLQWTSGKLDNAGEKLQLSQPGDKVGATRYYIPIDTVKYSDQTPWPVAADGTGPSLYRKLPTFAGKNYGNDPANWSASTPTPGR